MNTGPSRNPASSIHVVPVISPLPFIENQPANTGSFDPFPRGRTAVTPVRTGPAPAFNGPSPASSVVMPTSTPATSVIAFNGPGVPSNGTPRSRARGFHAAGAVGDGLCAWLCARDGVTAASTKAGIRRIALRVMVPLSLAAPAAAG